MGKTENKVGNTSRFSIACGAVGGACGFVAAGCLTLLVAILISTEKIPASVGAPLMLGVVVFGGILAGLIAAKRQGRGALPAGVFGGCILFALLCLTVIFSPQGVLFSMQTVKLAICALCGGLCGGALCWRRRGKKEAAEGKSNTNSYQWHEFT